MERLSMCRGVFIYCYIVDNGPSTAMQIKQLIDGTEFDVHIQEVYKILEALEKMGVIGLAKDNARPLSYVGTRGAYPGCGGVRVWEEWDG